MDRAAIEKIINERVKPGLESHGGDIELVDVKDGKVFVRLTGACGCCPHSQMTLKMGVEHIIKELVPEVTEVVAVD